MSRRAWIVATYIGLSLIVAAAEVALYRNGMLLRETTVHVWSGISALLLILWLHEDSRQQQWLDRPFDFGFLLAMYWLPFMPYYLWRTRGVSGLVAFVGLMVLPMLGGLVNLAVYLSM